MDVALNDAGTRVMLFKNTSPRPRPDLHHAAGEHVRSKC